MKKTKRIVIKDIDLDSPSLNEFVIEGITTTIDLHKKILNHKKFISSDFDVNWLMKESFY